MATKTKRVSDSIVQMRHLVLPNDTNMRQHLFGGKLMQWMDLAGAMAASKHANAGVATLMVDNFQFLKPIRLGAIVLIEACVTRAFSTSMEVKLFVYDDNHIEEKMEKSHEAYYTYVAVDKNNQPVKVPAIEPVTEGEKKEYEDAIFRRKLRLLYSNKIKDKEEVTWCIDQFSKRYK